MSTVKQTDRFLSVTNNLLRIAGPWLILSGILYIISQYNFLLFHSLAELFSISVAVAVFMLAWNTRRFMNNDFLFLIGLSYLFVALLDLFHTLSYKGMGVFSDDPNLPTQLWIAARYLQSFSFLSAVLLMRQKVNHQLLFTLFSGITLLLLASIARGIFPDCYVNGLTPFKKVSEYVISLIFAATILLLRMRTNWQTFSPGIHSLIILSLILTILAELTFTFYSEVYGVLNFLGHIFKIGAVYCIYKAVIATGLNQPFDLLFHDMKLREAELENSQKMLQEIAAHDPLTGLPNRLLFDARLTHALEECRRNNYAGLKSMVQVIIMDVDDFKNVNDLLGHLIGDEVLREIGRRLKAEIRASDTIARWGGDEFTCVMENVPNLKVAEHAAQKIWRAVSGPFHIQGRELRVRVSLGFSVFPIHGEESQTLLRNADAALYRAKEKKDKVQMYDESMNIFEATLPPSSPREDIAAADSDWTS
jgi:diguanylate cyclase (GGDEF)-like protein